MAKKTLQGEEILPGMRKGEKFSALSKKFTRLSRDGAVHIRQKLHLPDYKGHFDTTPMAVHVWQAKIWDAVGEGKALVGGRQPRSRHEGPVAFPGVLNENVGIALTQPVIPRAPKMALANDIVDKHLATKNIPMQAINEIMLMSGFRGSHEPDSSSRKRARPLDADEEVVPVTQRGRRRILHDAAEANE